MTNEVIIVLVIAGILLFDGILYNRRENKQEQKFCAEFVKAADALLNEEQ